MTNRKIKEPVKLRRKPLAGGNISLYLDIYVNGKRDYKFLQLYLVPEVDAAARRQNKQTLELANAIKSQYIVDIQRGIHNFSPRRKQKASFLDFMAAAAQHKLDTHEPSGRVWLSALEHIKRYDTHPDISFEDITPKWCKGFLDYLSTKAIKYSRHRKPTEGQLAKSVINAYFSKLRAALNLAVSKELIDSNPSSNIRVSQTRSDSRREYLTIDELHKISKIDCDDPELKRAFLFSCLTGLRRSDIEKLKWAEVYAERDRTRMIFHQKKTGGLEYLDITKQAADLLGEPAQPDDHVFSLPSPTYTNANLRVWASRAGINKHLTFHSGRHTFAVMMLTLGVDLYTVSKLLGHRDIKTTQIYARIVDSKKQEAVDIIPKIL